jgi:hypothetical protein
MAETVGGLAAAGPLVAVDALHVAGRRLLAGMLALAPPAGAGGGALLGERRVDGVVATVVVGGGALTHLVAGETVPEGSGVLLVAGAAVLALSLR